MNLTWKIYIVIILLFARGAFRVISLGSSMGICHLNLSVVNCLLTYPADGREIRSDPLLTLANLGLVFWPGTRISFALSLFSASWLGISANFPPPAAVNLWVNLFCVFAMAKIMIIKKKRWTNEFWFVLVSFLFLSFGFLIFVFDSAKYVHGQALLKLVRVRHAFYI